MLCLHDHAPSSGNNVFASVLGQLNIFIRIYQKKVGVINKSRQLKNIQIGTEKSRDQVFKTSIKFLFVFF